MQLRVTGRDLLRDELRKLGFDADVARSARRPWGMGIREWRSVAHPR
jgi:hypothetical protein